jgi:hypothetical protein
MPKVTRLLRFTAPQGHRHLKQTLKCQLETRRHIVISRRDIWNSDHVGSIGFCGQLGVIVVIGIQVERSARFH